MKGGELSNQSSTSNTHPGSVSTSCPSTLICFCFRWNWSCWSCWSSYCGCGAFAQGSDASSGIASAVGCVAVQSLYHLLVGGSSHVLPLEGSSPCRCMMVSLGVATPFAGEGVLHGTHVVGCGLVVGCDVWEGRAPSPQLCGTRQKLYFHRFDLHSSSLQRPRPLLVSQNRHMRIPEVN